MDDTSHDVVSSNASTRANMVQRWICSVNSAQGIEQMTGRKECGRLITVDYGIF